MLFAPCAALFLDSGGCLRNTLEFDLQQNKMQKVDLPCVKRSNFRDRTIPNSTFKCNWRVLNNAPYCSLKKKKMWRLLLTLENVNWSTSGGQSGSTEVWLLSVINVLFYHATKNILARTAHSSSNLQSLLFCFNMWFNHEEENAEKLQGPRHVVGKRKM